MIRIHSKRLIDVSGVCVFQDVVDTNPEIGRYWLRLLQQYLVECHNNDRKHAPCKWGKLDFNTLMIRCYIP